MGVNQRRNFKKKLAQKRNFKSKISQLGDTQGQSFAPEVVTSKESKQKNRRWSFYTVAGMDRLIDEKGKIVDTEEDAAKDADGKPVRRTIVHKMKSGALFIGKEAEAKRVALEINEDLKKLPQYEQLKDVRTYHEPHESISDVIDVQLRQLKSQNDVLQVALEIAADKIVVPSGTHGLGQAENEETDKMIMQVKQDLYMTAFKKLYQIKTEDNTQQPDNALVDGSGNTIQSAEASPSPTT